MDATEASTWRHYSTGCLMRAGIVVMMTLGATACTGIDFGDRHVGNVPKTDPSLIAPPENLKNGGEP